MSVRSTRTDIPRRGMSVRSVTGDWSNALSIIVV
jgi:hypothetical protein